MYNITRFSCPQMAQSIIFISSQAFTMRGHGVALGTSSLSTRPFSPLSKMSPSVPATLRARVEDIARMMKTARTVWRIFIFLRFEVLSETQRLLGTETPPEDWNIYSNSIPDHGHGHGLLSVLYYLIRPDRDSHIRHVCTVLRAPGETFYFLQTDNYNYSHFCITRQVV